jgi:hypothetical protein
MKAGRLSLAACVTLATLTMASAARAEKYVEIWNPPESRGHSMAPKPVRPRQQQPSTAPHLARKVTEPDSAAVQLGASAAASAAKRPSHPGPSSPANRGIPRKIGPDGNVFTV